MAACTPSPSNYNANNHQGKNNPMDVKKGDTGVLFESFFPGSIEISIGAIGDLLIHNRVYEDAATEDGYDFTPMFEPVTSYLQGPTITIANQETVIGGEDIGLSSYPRFNSPYALADAIQQSGVDLVTMANNHILDRGETAIQNAIRYYEKIGMEYTGSFKSREDRNQIRVIETDEGISVAFLSYTYGTNGIPTPAGKDYLVNRMDWEQIKQDVQKAEKLADVTVLSYHFGSEYERFASSEQKQLAQYAANMGVEVVIGHHPHVLQPLEWLEGKDGNQTLVAYSLGNFLSGQNTLYRRIGGMLQFSIEKDLQDQHVKVHSPAFLPTFVDYQIKNGRMTGFKVLPLHKVSESQLSHVNKHQNEIKEHLSRRLSELQFLDKE